MSISPQTGTPTPPTAVPSLPLDRHQAATAVLAAKTRTGLRWTDLGAAIDRSTEWTTAALLGQHPLTPEQARTLGAALGSR